jgi:AI-2 transport protein TqsA
MAPVTTSAPASNLLAVAAFLGLFALTIYLLVVGEGVFIPLVLAIFIAYLIIALSHMVERIKVAGKQLPGWFCMVAAIVIFLLAIGLIVQLIAGNVRDVVDAAPQYQERLQDLLANINATMTSLLPLSGPVNLTTLMEGLDLRSLAGRFAGALQSIAGNTFLILLYVAFLLLEYRTFDRKLAAMFPAKERLDRVRSTLAEIGQKTETYVAVKTVVSLLVGGISYVALLIFGVDFAGFWALLIFILNFIPYIGSLIAVLFPTVLSLLQFGSLGIFAMVLTVLAGAQVFVGNVLEPRLMGKSLNLSPLIILIALSVWGALWGVTGMILSVPITVIGTIILAQFPQTRPIAVFMSERGDVR